MVEGWSHVGELVGMACGAEVVAWHRPNAQGAWTVNGWAREGTAWTELPQGAFPSLAQRQDLVARVLREQVALTEVEEGMLPGDDTRLLALRQRLKSGACLGGGLAPGLVWIGLPGAPDPGRLAAVGQLLRLAGSDLLMERTERQLVHQRRLEAVDRMVSGVAHELNNPLQTVVGNAEMLSAMKLPDSAHRRAQRVLAGARRCQEVVDGLLKLKRKRRELSKTVSLEEPLRRAVRRLETEFSVGRLTTRVQVEDPVPRVCGDEVDLEQAMENVIRNGFQAVARRPDAEVTITLGRVGDSVEVGVVDNGEGMTPEIQVRAFEPFFTTRGVGAGKGLGLSIALGIVEEHGGIIELQPQEEGMRVVLVLPAG